MRQRTPSISTSTHACPSNVTFIEEGESELVLDYWVDDEMRRAFQHHFGVGVGGSEELSRAASALNLFQALQTLLTLNYFKVDEETKAELYDHWLPFVLLVCLLGAEWFLRKRWGLV